ncbi:hypothetical protein LCGC14_0737740 [marine sediment metagenome]|uniref:Uncharacterized protein n=1 Tax=marine sediment metagenome TaxID=412755 RepID=A0A0F9TEU8_9ZZZZ
MKNKLDLGMMLILILSSIFTLGMINIAMFLIDGITPKEFFNSKLNPILKTQSEEVGGKIK